MNIRTATREDAPQIQALYKAVARETTGLARREHEISDNYVMGFVSKSVESGLIIVAENPDGSGKLIGEIHAYNPGIDVFRHVLSDLTIAVHPAFQGRKIGRTLFTIFLEEIAVNRPHIGRVELITRESNVKAIKFYQSLGSLVEGRLEMRIRTPENHYEADIPMGWQNPNFEFDNELS
ncbi:MAG TPA: N-acetyltransferase [Chryseosolibacter sp.]|nr:N-acetyltransferase [Chryseosolibacter sp.]